MDPFSTARIAATLPAKPEPITITSNPAIATSLFAIQPTKRPRVGIPSSR